MIFRPLPGSGQDWLTLSLCVLHMMQQSARDALHSLGVSAAVADVAVRDAICTCDRRIGINMILTEENQGATATATALKLCAVVMPTSLPHFLLSKLQVAVLVVH
jgi:hypothetical protein